MKRAEKRLSKNMLILISALTICLSIMACRKQANKGLEGVQSGSDIMATKSDLVMAVAGNETTTTTGGSGEKAMDKEENVVEGKGAITHVGQDWYGIAPDAETGTCYAPAKLAEELKIDNLRVYFKGRVGEIPPNVRMWGTPFVLIEIRKLDSSDE